MHVCACMHQSTHTPLLQTGNLCLKQHEVMHFLHTHKKKMIWIHPCTWYHCLSMGLYSTMELLPCLLVCEFFWLLGAPLKWFWVAAPASPLWLWPPQAAQHQTPDTPPSPSGAQWWPVHRAWWRGCEGGEEGEEGERGGRGEGRRRSHTDYILKTNRISTQIDHATSTPSFWTRFKNLIL